MAQRVNVICYMALFWWAQCSHCDWRSKHHTEMGAMREYLNHLTDEHPRVVKEQIAQHNAVNQLQLAFGMEDGD